MKIKTPAVYYATDRRCYDGAPSDDLSKERNNINKLTHIMTKLDPDAQVVYFPAEHKYRVFTGNTPIPHVFHECKQQAMIEAIRILTSKESFT